MSTQWYDHPQRQATRSLALTTETTATIDLAWTDADLVDANELVIKEIRHWSAQNVSRQVFDVKIQQPPGTDIAGGFQNGTGSAVHIPEGHGKEYSRPGLYLKKENGTVRILMTLGVAMNPGRLWVTFHKNKVS